MTDAEIREVFDRHTGLLMHDLHTEIAARHRPRLKRCPDWRYLPQQVQVQRKHDGLAAVVIKGQVWSQTSRIHAPALESAFSLCDGPTVIEVVSTLQGRSTVADALHLRAHDPDALCAVVISGECPTHSQVQACWQQTVQREDLPALWAQVQADGWEGIVIDGRWKRKAAYTADLVAVARCLDSQGSTTGLLVAVARDERHYCTVGEISAGADLDDVASVPGPALPASSGAQLDWIQPTPVQAQITACSSGRGWDLMRDGEGLALLAASASASVSGQLERVRPDKLACADDCGAEQLGITLAAPASRPATEAGQIIEVLTYFREAGTEPAVRKWAIIHNDRPGFHSWIVHHTDYSPARQQRLRRTVRVAESLTHAQDLLDAWIADTSLARWSEYAG